MNETEGQEIRDIISELRRLHLREGELLDRLQQLNSNPPVNRDANRQGAPDRPRTATRVATRVVRPPPTAPRQFAVGDIVKIRNPNPFQSSIGTIEKIGTNRITVRDKDGKAIQRAEKNIIANDD
jgi:transcription antitermination factor NusG